jgi:hypothetical protein
MQIFIILSIIVAILGFLFGPNGLFTGSPRKEEQRGGGFLKNLKKFIK